MSQNQLMLVRKEQFGKVICDFYRDENDDVFMTRKQIGEALEYADSQNGIDMLHSRHADRLDNFSISVKLSSTDGKFYNTILYSVRGIHEICRWSRQPKADAFIDWIRDVIEIIRKTGRYELVKDENIFNVLTKIYGQEEAQRLGEINSTSVQVEYGFPFQDDSMVMLEEVERIFHIKAGCFRNELKDLKYLKECYVPRNTYGTHIPQYICRLTEKGLTMGEELVNKRRKRSHPLILIRYKKAYILPLFKYFAPGFRNEKIINVYQEWLEKWGEGINYEYEYEYEYKHKYGTT